MLCRAIVFMSLFSWTFCLDNGLARTPPMGWLSWERFRCTVNCDLAPNDCLSERLFKTMADLLVSEGFKEAGYVYLVLDDCWMAPDRINNRLIGDPDRFPNGMRDLSDYIHSKGLKFGIYGNYGKFTCSGFPGSRLHLETDAFTFASWGADYVKFDGCFADELELDEGYSTFGKYLNATGRPIVYSCSWPYYQHANGMTPNYTAIVDHCNLWRNFNDIHSKWKGISDVLSWYGQNQDLLTQNAGPGHWNDPDMLVIGNYGITVHQAVAQMTLWAILSAPLMISADLRTIAPEYKQILLNKEVIAINQDPLGFQGKRIHTGAVEVWLKPILPMEGSYYSFAIAFLNHIDSGASIDFTKTLLELGLINDSGYKMKDVFGQIEYGILNPESEITVWLQPSSSILLKAIVQPNSFGNDPIVKIVR